MPLPYDTQGDPFKPSAFDIAVTLTSVIRSAFAVSRSKRQHNRTRVVELNESTFTDRQATSRGLCHFYENGDFWQKIIMSDEARFSHLNGTVNE